MTGIHARLAGSTVRSRLTLVNSLVPVDNPERTVGGLEEFIRARWDRSRGGITGLAKSIGSSTESIYAWFRGDSEPSMAHLRELAIALDVTRAELVMALDGSGPTPDVARVESATAAALDHQAVALNDLVGLLRPFVEETAEAQEVRVRAVEAELSHLARRVDVIQRAQSVPDGSKG